MRTTRGWRGPTSNGQYQASLAHKLHLPPSGRTGPGGRLPRPTPTLTHAAAVPQATFYLQRADCDKGMPLTHNTMDHITEALAARLSGTWADVHRDCLDDKPGAGANTHTRVRFLLAPTQGEEACAEVVREHLDAWSAGDTTPNLRRVASGQTEVSRTPIRDARSPHQDNGTAQTTPEDGKRARTWMGNGGVLQRHRKPHKHIGRWGRQRNTGHGHANLPHGTKRANHLIPKRGRWHNSRASAGAMETPKRRGELQENDRFAWKSAFTPATKEPGSGSGELWTASRLKRLQAPSHLKRGGSWAQPPAGSEHHTTCGTGNSTT